MTERDWSAYIEQFHQESPGVTESVLGRAVDADGVSPYCWAAAGAKSGPVLDVGCGNGPAHSLVAGWVGVDASQAELRAARASGGVLLIAARAKSLPIRDGSVGAALLVMSLMVIDDTAAVLAELTRVLHPPRTVCVLVPTVRPTTAGDRVRYGALLAALGRARMPFPRPDVVRNPRASCPRGGRLAMMNGAALRSPSRSAPTPTSSSTASTFPACRPGGRAGRTRWRTRG